MLRRYLFALGGTVLPLTLLAQSIVGVGSSTISGEGAIPKDSSWLNLLGNFYSRQGLNVSITNVGWPGSTSFNGMPSSYRTPTAVFNDSTPLLYHNITYAWLFNPDIVIIAYPSNDVVLNFSIQQWLSNLRTIYDSVSVLGRTAWVATSQPRDDVGPDVRQLLKEVRDSILLEFAGHALDFYDVLADPATMEFQSGLTDDGIHPNNTGHELLFEVARDANLVSMTPLPLSIAGFSAVWNKGEIDLAWRVTGTGIGSGSSVERSGDGVDFTAIWEEQKTDAALAYHRFADRQPLSGRNFYRIKLAEGATIHYSPIVSLVNAGAGWKLERLYPAGTSAIWKMDLSTSVGGQVTIRVFDAPGKSVLIKRINIAAPGGSFALDLSTLAAGQYFMQVTTEQGPVAARPIQRW
jgi:lysophospholipase L1-like esterase